MVKWNILWNTQSKLVWILLYYISSLLPAFSNYFNHSNDFKACRYLSSSCFQFLKELIHNLNILLYTLVYIRYVEIPFRYFHWHVFSIFFKENYCLRYNLEPVCHDVYDSINWNASRLHMIRTPRISWIWW